MNICLHILYIYICADYSSGFVNLCIHENSIFPQPQQLVFTNLNEFTEVRLSDLVCDVTVSSESDNHKLILNKLGIACHSPTSTFYIGPFRVLF